MNKVGMACVIDDDQIFTFAVKRMIEHAEVANETLFFYNGKTALDYFIANKDQEERLPDLVLLDLNMPILDGWQFLDSYAAILSQLKKKVTLYIVSSSIDDSDHQRAQKIESVSDFVVKPFGAEILREMVDLITAA